MSSISLIVKLQDRFPVAQPLRLPKTNFCIHDGVYFRRYYEKQAIVCLETCYLRFIDAGGRYNGHGVPFSFIYQNINYYVNALSNAATFALASCDLLSINISMAVVLMSSLPLYTDSINLGG